MARVYTTHDLNNYFDDIQRLHQFPDSRVANVIEQARRLRELNLENHQDTATAITALKTTVQVLSGLTSAFRREAGEKAGR
ncbi:hypothetical protein [Yoonia sp. R2-816]|uniref:hypothetical protein n=1 Tax=Yoonia sp. R2-816 TaxID=3342638 RepID=UPI00372B76D6